MKASWRACASKTSTRNRNASRYSAALRMHIATAQLEALTSCGLSPEVVPRLSMLQALAEAFTRDDLDEAATLAKQLRYITRIGEAIREKG